MTPDHLYELIMALTDDPSLAETYVAEFELDRMKKEAHNNVQS